MSGYLLKFKQTYSVKIGGRRYPVVKIGNQLWMAENLDWKFDVNGSQIHIGGPSVESPNAWYYDNNETDYGLDGTYKCGLLYNGYAVQYLDANSSDLLPNGWRVPTSNDFSTLTNEIGGASSSSSKIKALDDSATLGFPSSWGGTNDYGFSALPAGGVQNGNFVQFNNYAFFYENSGSYSTYMDRTSRIYLSAYGYTWHAYSIRLVKDVA